MRVGLSVKKEDELVVRCLKDAEGMNFGKGFIGLDRHDASHAHFVATCCFHFGLDNEPLRFCDSVAHEEHYDGGRVALTTSTVARCLVSLPADRPAIMSSQICHLELNARIAAIPDKPVATRATSESIVE